MGGCFDASFQYWFFDRCPTPHFLFRFHAYNIGHLSSRAADPLFAPCTPAGVIRLLESTGVSLSGLHAVVLGRSDIVGSPVAALLRSKDATVTQCHSRTKNIEEIVLFFSLTKFGVVLICTHRSKPLMFWSLPSGKLNLLKALGLNPVQSLLTSVLTMYQVNAPVSFLTYGHLTSR